MVTIPCDLPCAGCGYNLRGLSPESGGLCPECGRSISTSVIRRRSFRSTEERRFSAQWREHLLDVAAGSSGLTTEALGAVLAGVARAVSVLERHHVEAGEVCVAVFHVVLERAGRRALTELEELGLASPRAVGCAVFALGRVGMIQTEERDRIEDFTAVPAMADFWAMASRPDHSWYGLTQADVPPDDRSDRACGDSG